MSSAKTAEGVLIEISTLGSYAKVNAIDTATGTEVTVMGPANAGKAVLQAAVLRKLEFVMNKAKPAARGRSDFGMV